MAATNVYPWAVVPNAVQLDKAMRDLVTLANETNVQATAADPPGTSPSEHARLQAGRNNAKHAYQAFQYAQKYAANGGDRKKSVALLQSAFVKMMELSPYWKERTQNMTAEQKNRCLRGHAADYVRTFLNEGANQTVTL